MQKNLWITISSNTTMDRHVTNICRSTYGELRRISSIRHPLTVNATQTLLSAFVLSKSLLQLPLLWLTSIHSGQVSKSTKFCSKISHEIQQVWTCTTSFAQPSLVTSPLKDWLQDFNALLQHYHSSLDTCTLHIPFIRTKSFRQRAFCFTGPTQ